MSKYTNFNNSGNSMENFSLGQDQQLQNTLHPNSKWHNPKYIEQLNAMSRIQESKKLDLHTACNVISENKKWVYPNLLQEGELTILAGSPGDGKTTFACALAAGITIGKEYLLHPELTPRGDGHVIIINREDDEAKGLKARLIAAGANLEKVHFIGGKIGRGDNSPFSFSNDRDIDRLMGMCEFLENNIGLIIIDPIYFAVDGDQNSDQKARLAYEKLAALAKLLSCAILGIAHTVRNTQGKLGLGRIAGPPAIRQVPRQIILLSKIINGPTETDGTHVLVQVKNSEGNMDGGFEYRISPVELPIQNSFTVTPKLVFTQKLMGSSDEILEWADFGMTNEKISKLDYAVKFLKMVLKDGPRLWIDIEKLAVESNVKKGTLMNAKTCLKIVVNKVTGNKGRSQWSLPNELDGRNNEC